MSTTKQKQHGNFITYVSSRKQFIKIKETLRNLCIYVDQRHIVT